MPPALLFTPPVIEAPFAETVRTLAEVIAPAPVVWIFPLVVMLCEPKLGEIFVPAIAAVAEMSALTMVSSAIFTDVTAESASLEVPMEPSSMTVEVTAPGAI